MIHPPYPRRRLRPNPSDRALQRQDRFGRNAIRLVGKPCTRESRSNLEGLSSQAALRSSVGSRSPGEILLPSPPPKLEPRSSQRTSVSSVVPDTLLIAPNPQRIPLVSVSAS